jgi:hypothetical protein
MLCDRDWQLLPGVSGQPFAPIFKAQRVQEEWVITSLKEFNFLTRPLVTAALFRTLPRIRTIHSYPHTSSVFCQTESTDVLWFQKLAFQDIWNILLEAVSLTNTDQLHRGTYFMGKSTIRFSVQAV